MKRLLVFVAVLAFVSVSTKVSQAQDLWAGGQSLPGTFRTDRQPDGISCGPTCCRMVLNYYGISAGVGPLKTDAGTRWFQSGNRSFGMTLPSGIERALERNGVGATIYNGNLSNIVDLIKQNRPPILLVRSGAETWHYVVAIGYSNGTDKIQIADPGTGQKTWLSGRALDLGWTFSGDYYGQNRYQGADCKFCSGGWWTEKYTGFKTKCATCNGKGRFPDYARKAVETAGVSGHTMIVPDRASSSGLATYKIWIENPTKNRVSFKLNGSKHQLEPNQTKWFSRVGNSDFNIEFDWSFQEGYQKRGFRLTAGRRHFFKIEGNGLNFYHRE